MSESRGTLDALVVPAANALSAVGEILADDGAEDLLSDLGYKIPGGSDLEDLFGDVVQGAGDLSDALGDVIQAYEDGTYEDASFLLKVLELATAVGEIATAADGLADRAETVFNAAPGFLQDGKIDQLPRRLVDYLVIRYMAREHPRLAAAFALMGVLTDEFVPEGEYNPDFYLLEVHWDRIPKWFSEPGKVIEEEYSWGHAEFADHRFLHRFKLLLWQFGVPAVSTHVVDAQDPSAPGSTELDVPVFSGSIEIPDEGLAGVVIGLALRRDEDPADIENAGLAIEPYVEGSVDLAIELREGWTLTLTFGLEAEGLALTIHPATGTAVDADGEISGEIGVRVGRSGNVLGPLILFGNAGGTRLQIDDVSLGVIASASTDPVEGFDAGIELKVDGLALIVQASEGDGFLRMVLPQEPLEMRLDMLLGLSRKRGLYFSGGAGLEYTFHLDAELGPIFIKTIDLGVKLDQSALAMQVAASGGLKLGPIVAVVQQIGLIAKLELGKPGNLGNANLGLGFKPPSGIGMSIDTPAVKAAGFLLIDPEHGRYAGALGLSVLEKFDLAAIALINTKMPDGSEGFSFLLIIGITFPVPIPLSYNFYFAGAGGLLGLNRSVDIDRLRIGLRSGAADSVLLPSNPKDIVLRMDAIVRDLEEIFPVAKGQFLVGPIAVITWSSPPIISVKIGVIIEIGTPIRVAILGVLRASLPDPKDAVVNLKVAFLGAIDIQNSLLSFDASIYDSFIGFDGYKLTIEGDIALRVCWGPQPELLMSVGGFHPVYKPPAYLKLPPMRRISLSLAKDNPRLSLSTYMAITSNTAQFGARADLALTISSFSITGGFSMDVLFQFSPFSLQADISARLSVKAGGSELLSIGLEFSLSGPTPWIARGKANFKILFFEVSVEFEKRFGAEALNTLPDVAVLAAILGELGIDTNWRGELVDGASALVTLTAPKPVTGTVLIDPGGAVTVSQRVLPLDTEFSLFGNSRVSDAQTVRIKELRLGGDAVDLDAVTEPFAPAAYRVMSDNDKLAAPAYESRPSGVQATSDNDLRADYAIGRSVEYEVISSDVAGGGTEQHHGPQADDDAVFEALVPGGAAGSAPQSRTRMLREEKGTILGAGVARDRYAVASVSDLRPLDEDGDVAVPLGVDTAGRARYDEGVLLLRTDAEARLGALADQLPGLQVVPESQLVA